MLRQGQDAAHLHAGLHKDLEAVETDTARQMLLSRMAPQSLLLSFGTFIQSTQKAFAARFVPVDLLTLSQLTHGLVP